MIPERWQEVKKMLGAALEREPAVRAAYLDQACTEPSLRREVDSLIAAHEQGENTFMDQAAAARGELRSGTKLGPYEIIALLGAGGMGEVYRARDLRLDRDVALKVLPTGLFADDAARRRFRKEELALAKLNHPHIAAIYDVGQEGGVDYLVMECVPGQSLAEQLKSGAFPQKEVISLGAQIADALGEAHDHGIVHRDLKPGNIMVTPKGQVKVLDFGLAKLLRLTDDTTATESLTETQSIAGTLPYMAPEQLRGETVDGRTDLWAFGAVLYEMATGRKPFPEEMASRLIDSILHQAPVAPRFVNGRVAPELEHIIVKCLEKDPDNRYPSANDLRVDFRRLSAPAPAVEVKQRASRSRNLYGAVGLAGLVLLLCAGVVLFRSAKPPIAVPSEYIQLTDFPDSATAPNLSPDGRMVTFIRGGSAFLSRGQIYVKLLPNSESVRLTNELAQKYAPVFTPDGSRVAITQ